MALQALRDLGGFREGGSVPINGGASGVGHFAAQIWHCTIAGLVLGAAEPDNC
jgi:NADPH:quinone reductase-like Zn-dependent oxidoreductase